MSRFAEALAMLPAEAHARDWQGGLPGRAYVSPAMFDGERAAVFDAGWVCLGAANALANRGRYRRFDVAGEPLLLVRGDDGVLRALSAVCRHRGATIAEGCGETARFVCPYHGWSYGLDGRLLGAPLMGRGLRNDAAANRLPEFALSPFLGLVFVNLSLTPAVPPAKTLEAICPHLEPYRLGECAVHAVYDEELPCDWKLPMENAMESYHHIAVHRATLQDLHPAALVHAGECGEDYAIHYNPHRHPPMDAQPGSPVRVGGLELRGEQVLASTILSIFPNVTLSLGLGTALIALVLPVAAGRCRFILDYAVHPSVAHRFNPRGGLEQQLDLIRSFNDEDVALLRNLGRSMHSRHAASRPLNPREATIGAFHRFIARRLAAVANLPA